MKRHITTILILLCLGVAGFSGYKVVSGLLAYRTGDRTYSNLEEHMELGGQEVEIRVHQRAGGSADGGAAAGQTGGAAEAGTYGPGAENAAGARADSDANTLGDEPGGASAGMAAGTASGMAAGTEAGAAGSGAAAGGNLAGAGADAAAGGNLAGDVADAAAGGERPGAESGVAAGTEQAASGGSLPRDTSAGQQRSGGGAGTGTAGTALGAAAGGSGESHGELLRITLPQVDFDALKKENPDTVGWIYCEDTRINYPVVQGPDNDRYLHTMFTGERNAAGAIFMDSENRRDMTDFNTILYGHHMKNGSMFHDLVDFKEEDFFRKHPYMLYLTPEKNYLVEVYAAFVASLEDDCWRIDFGKKEEKEAWLRFLKEKSDFPAAIEAQPEDHMLTLSTCSYEFEDARYVLYGLLTEIPGTGRTEAGANQENSRDSRTTGTEHTEPQGP